MGRIIIVFGILGAVIVAAGSSLGMAAVPDGGGAFGMVIGYLTMLVALSMVFVGVRRYRDTVRGGIVHFWQALGVGLAISLIASLGYVINWEAYLYATDYSFVDGYAKSVIVAQQAAGASATEIAKLSAEMDQFKQEYANPLFRLSMTFAEIAPVGLLVSLVSAALLRNPRLLPARRA